MKRLSDMDDEELFAYALKGDVEARALILYIYRLAHAMDDMVDRDKPMTDREMYEVFWLALVQIPSNGFYRRHAKELIPLAATSLLNWAAATDIEKREKPALEDLHVAHVIRHNVADAYILIATIIGGPQHGFEVAAELRTRAQRESFQNYLKEFDHA